MDEEISKSLPKQSNLKYYNKKQRFKSDSDHILKKRVPPRDVRKPNDIYITNKSDFKGQLAHCIKILEQGECEIILHGLGAAVPRALNLALQIEDKFSGSYGLDVNTSTIHLVVKTKNELTGEIQKMPTIYPTTLEDILSSISIIIMSPGFLLRSGCSCSRSLFRSIDDLEPVSNFHEPRSQTRCNSCVKIRVFKSS